MIVDLPIFPLVMLILLHMVDVLLLGTACLWFMYFWWNEPFLWWNRPLFSGDLHDVSVAASAHPLPGSLDSRDLGLAPLIWFDNFCLETRVFGPFTFNVIMIWLGLSPPSWLFVFLLFYVLLTLYSIPNFLGVNQIFFSVSFYLLYWPIINKIKPRLVSGWSRSYNMNS